MNSSNLNQSLDDLYESADQLTYHVAAKFQQEDFEPIDELKAFTIQLIELLTKTVFDDLNREPNSIQGFKDLVENLIVFTRLLKQTVSKEQNNLSRLHEAQIWFRDEILQLLLEKEVLRLVLREEKFEVFLNSNERDVIEKPIPNPPPPPRKPRW